MLWDLIRDFFVQHVFGGTASNGNFYGGLLGYIFAFNQSGEYIEDGYYSVNEIGFSLGTNYFMPGGEPSSLYISYGDWFSTTATIVSISIIVVLCCLFVYKIIKLIGGLIR